MRARWPATVKHQFATKTVVDRDWWPARRDLALTLAVAAFAMTTAGIAAVRGGTMHPVVAGAVTALAVLPLAWRRHWPVPIFALVTLGMLAPGASGAVFVALLIAAFSLGAHAPRLPALVAIAVAAPVLLVGHSGQWQSLAFVAPMYILLGTCWLIGWTVQTREQQAAALSGQIAQLERDQAEATRTAIADERRRIARELHDVVTHNVSVMVVQAGAARHVMETAPDAAREALLAVEATGREALTELRHLLGLLSQEDADDAMLAPQPGIAHLPALVARAQNAGLPVTFREEGAPYPLPQGQDLAVYRIVQEALTNTLKHSGLIPTTVCLRYRPDGLAVEVADSGSGKPERAPTSPGRGLVGMRERAALYGGTLDAGPCPDGGYRVRAWFPLTAREREA